MTRAEKIVEIARLYIGQEEILGNKGFKDSKLQDKMILAGWQVGFAWCSLLAEIIWKQAYADKPTIILQLNKLFSASALSTYYNFAQSKDFKVGKEARIGALVIWKHGTDPANHAGHLGIVTELATVQFLSVEGNTTGDDPNMREGYVVAEKPHYYSVPISQKGLNIVGFVYPNE